MQDAAIWLELRKKGATGDGVVYAEAVEEALCFGWIDSKAKRPDDERYAMWFARRKPKSTWSAVNRARVYRLLAEGRMADPGLATVALAKDNGAWDALNDSDALQVPDDLAAALADSGDARRHWDALATEAMRYLTWTNAWVKGCTESYIRYVPAGSEPTS